MRIVLKNCPIATDTGMQVNSRNAYGCYACRPASYAWASSSALCDA